MPDPSVGEFAGLKVTPDGILWQTLSATERAIGLPQQSLQPRVQFHLGQEPLGVCRRRLRCVRSVAIEHQFGRVEQKLFRGYAGVDREKLKTGALIEVEAKVHMLNLSAQLGLFNRTVVTVCGDLPEVEQAVHRRAGLNTARKRL
ncbi:MAG TPA: hypothetical protein VJU82_05355 [Acidobacteriaceae bacterium]|nr:hypothetical protein [Acidobacteriaceae bacterium]